MKHYDSLIIGRITKDFNIDHLKNENEICGGAGLFSSASAFALGHSTGAVKNLAAKDSDRPNTSLNTTSTTWETAVGVIFRSPS